jgi:translation initiation factor 1
MSDTKTPFHNPFGALGALRDKLPASKTVEPERVEAAAPGPPTRKYARAVVRLERSGRGGKEVTVIEHLNLTPGDREHWLRALKAALGCGGQVEGETIMLQGDHRKRLPKLLTDRGVKKVTLGS